MTSKKPLAYVITHHWLANFGANLQAYATSIALQKRGFQVQFLNYRPTELVNIYCQRISKAQLEEHENFVQTYLPSTIVLPSHQHYLDYIQKYPAILYVTGSDAVFRVSKTKKREDLNLPNPFWLPGTPLIDGNKQPLKVALSPSAMGHNFDTLSHKDQEWIKHALNDFDILSSRDPFTMKQMLSVGYSGIIENTPDPVFSLAEQIQRIRREKYDPENKYILIGTQKRMTSQWIKKFTELANQKGFQTVSIPSPEGIVDFGTNKQIQLPLDSLQWMQYLACADGYVGGRFHPLVVSLCAGVPIFSVDVYHRWPWQRSRSKSWLLLKQFSLSKYCFSGVLHRILPPFIVFRMLCNQQENKGRDASAKKALLLSDKFNTFVDQFSAFIG